MEHVDNVYSGLRHYFGALEEMGTYNKKDTQGLLIYSFLVDQVLEGPLGQYLDDTGLVAINKVLRCIAGSSCLVNVSASEIRLSAPRNNWLHSLSRISESSDLRISEEDSPRYAESGVRPVSKG